MGTAFQTLIASSVAMALRSGSLADAGATSMMASNGSTISSIQARNAVNDSPARILRTDWWQSIIVKASQACSLLSVLMLHP